MFAGGGSDRVSHSLARIDELINTGHLHSAMEEALLALGASPNYLAIHLRMAEILFKSGRQEQAMKKLKVVAETHRIRGEVRQATEVYLRVLSFAPVDIPARRRGLDLLGPPSRPGAGPAPL